MKKMRTRPGAGRSKGGHRTVCATGEDWEMVRDGARRAGMSVSAWWFECALNVDLSAKGGKARAPVLDAGRQHSLADGVSALARGLDAADEEALAQYRDDIRAMLEEPLRAMVRQGKRERAMELLREVFGEERAAAIAAAFIPETLTMADKPAECPARTADAGRPGFGEDA